MTTSVVEQDYYEVLLGKRVDLPYSQLFDCGTVAFVGEVSFAGGVWLGIKLDSPTGKNNGVVNDIKYFDAEEKHGIFLRPSRCKLAKSGAYAHAFIDGRKSIAKKRLQSVVLKEGTGSLNSDPPHVDSLNSKSPHSSEGKSYSSKFRDKNLKVLYEKTQRRLSHTGSPHETSMGEKKNVMALTARCGELERVVASKELELSQLQSKIETLVRDAKKRDLDLEERSTQLKLLSGRMEKASSLFEEDRASLQKKLAEENSLRDSQVTKIKSDNMKLIDEINQKDKLLKKAEETVKRLKHENTKLQFGYQEVTTSLKSKDEKIEHLETLTQENQPKDLENALREYQMLQASYKKLADESRLKIAEMKQENYVLLSKHTSQTDIMQMEIQKLQNENSEILELQLKNKSELQKGEEKLVSSKSLMSKLKGKMLNTEAELRNLKQETETLRTTAETVAPLKKQIEALTAHVKELGESAEKMYEEKHYVLEKNERLSAEIKALKEFSDGKNAKQIIDLRKRLVEMELKVTEAVNSENKMQKKNLNITNELRTLQKNQVSKEVLAEHMRQLSASQESVNKLQAEKEEILKLIEVEKEKNSDLEARMNSLQEISERKRQEFEADAEKSALREKVKENEILQLKSKNSQLRKRNNELQSASESMTAKCKKLEAALLAFGSKGRSSTESRSGLESAGKSKPNKHDELTKQLDSLSAEWEKSQKQGSNAQDVSNGGAVSVVATVSDHRKKIEKREGEKEGETSTELEDILLSREENSGEGAQKLEPKSGNTVVKKKSVNRNDAAAEQWARFYEQHGETVAKQHGYTKAHYEQYLRRGGTPGGQETF
jgi:DNA repair exonuclease SbcCD ATPase subunit